MFIISILISENYLELMQSRCPLVAQRDPFPPSKLFQSPCTGTDPIHIIIETTNWRVASEWLGYLEFQSHLVFVAIALPIHHCSQCHLNWIVLWINSRWIEPGDIFSRICRFKHYCKNTSCKVRIRESLLSPSLSPIWGSFSHHQCGSQASHNPSIILLALHRWML